MFARGSKVVQSSGSGADSGSGNRQELNVAYVLLVMASLPLLIYVPNAVFWFPYVVMSLLPNWSAQVSTLLAMLGRITISLGIAVHFWNIFFYSFCVTGFLQELVRILACGLIKLETLASQSSHHSIAKQ